MRQKDLIRKLKGVKDPKKVKKHIKDFLKTQPVEKIREYSVFYDASIKALEETDNSARAKIQLQEAGYTLLAGSYPLTHKIACTIRRRKLRNPLEELKIIKKKKRDLGLLIDPASATVSEKVKAHYENLNGPERDSYLNFFLKASEALCRKKTVKEAQMYLESRGDFPFSDSAFSFHYQISCLVAKEPIRTPQEELSQNSRLRSPKRGGRKLGAVLGNTQFRDGHSSLRGNGYHY